MALGVAVLLVAAAAALEIGLMLFIRRRAPAGGYFSDSDRAAGVFGMLGTGLAVLLGFVIFLAFEDYGKAKTDAEDEATATLQQFENARLFDPTNRDLLEADLLCYARAVVHEEWPDMERGGARSPAVEAWVLRLDRAAERVVVTTNKQDDGYRQWLEQTATRERARHGRLLEARHPLPTLLWLMLIIGSTLVMGYVLFWADSAERRGVQAMIAGSVTALVAASLLLVYFLNSPFGTHSGSIKPYDMRSAVALMQEQLPPGDTVPCDSAGRPRTS